MDAIIEELRALRASVEALRAKSAMPELWSLEQIATWFGQCERTTRDTIKMPGFPKAVPGATKNQRWFADEVVSWARTRRSKR